MKIKSTIHLSTADRSIMTDALAVSTILPPLAQRGLSSYLRGGRNGVLTDSQVEMLIRSMEQMKTILADRTKAEPDPSWIRENQVIEARGGVPLMADPAAIMAMIRDNSQRQFEAVNEGIRLLTRAQRLMKVADATRLDDDSPDSRP